MQKNYRVATLSITCTMLLCLLVPSLVRAQASLQDAVAMLNANDRDQVEAAIQNLGMLGKTAAIKPLENRIRHGLPKDLLELSIMTLMALGDPSAGPILFELATHRRPEIRLIAIEAVTAINPPGAESVLLQALSDSETSVRSKAALGLGEIKAKNALDTLFLALDRGVLEASTAIGKVVPSNRVGHLMGYLNKVPLRSLGPAITQVLTRSDIPLKTKLDIIVQLEEIATPEVKGILMDFLSNHGESAPKPLIRSLRRAIQQIAD